MGVTQAPPRRYFAVGADIRGLDQDNSERITNTLVPATVFTYNEDLDTRYYGAYGAWGSDYRLPGIGNITSGWSLQSSFLLRGGIYYADTDYKGNLVAPALPGTASANSALSLSDNETAFIGGNVLKTEKRFGSRASLSLKGSYEYYSYVPEMACNQVDFRAGFATTQPNGQNGTRLGDDDAWSARTSLRLTIGLGPRTLYQEPMK